VIISSETDRSPSPSGTTSSTVPGRRP